MFQYYTGEHFGTILIGDVTEIPNATRRRHGVYCGTEVITWPCLSLSPTNETLGS